MSLIHRHDRQLARPPKTLFLRPTVSAKWLLCWSVKSYKSHSLPEYHKKCSPTFCVLTRTLAGKSDTGFLPPTPTLRRSRWPGGRLCRHPLFCAPTTRHRPNRPQWDALPPESRLHLIPGHPAVTVSCCPWRPFYWIYWMVHDYWLNIFLSRWVLGFQIQQLLYQLLLFLTEDFTVIDIHVLCRRYATWLYCIVSIFISIVMSRAVTAQVTLTARLLLCSIY